MTSVAVLAAQHQALTVRLQERLKAIVAGLWDGLADVDDAAMADWLGQIIPLVTAAETHGAADMAGYLALVVAEMTNTPPRFAGVAANLVTGAIIRQGTAPEAVYARPLIQTRSLLANGVSIDEALQAGRVRALSLAATDTQSARVYAARHVMETEPRIQGYRRNLTGGHSCGLCVVASTRRYHKQELLPRHPGCDCGVLPIVGGHDPGQVINRPLLDQLHANVAATFGPDAVNLSADSDAYRGLVATYEHGEYGPTLMRAGDSHLTSAAADAR